MCLGRCVGKPVPRTGARRSRLCSDHGRIGPALEQRLQASFSQFEFSKFDGSLAPKLRFPVFHFHFLREVSNESFVFTSSTCRFWGKCRTKDSFSYLPLACRYWRKSRTKASFSHLQLSLLADVSHESFVLTSSTCTFWGKSCTRASFSYLPLSLFEGRLARKLPLQTFNAQILKGSLLRKLPFRTFHVQILREVSHEMDRGSRCTKCCAL